MEFSIPKPKVFISYAWGTEEYNNSVISFATSLKNEGINVVFDRWQLREGQDTYAFMEKSVMDPEITNILILIDPTYTNKADNRNGGVGTETQIISPEVYGQVEQTKVIPIIFQRDENGQIAKPRFLKSRLHFDLTNKSKYNIEYQRLVRRLYGIETIKEPELGTPPAWLDNNLSISHENSSTILEPLIISFIDETNLSTESDISFFEDEKRMTRILKLSSEIKTKLDRSNSLSSEFIRLIDKRVDDYIDCRETCLCIRDCGEVLCEHSINESVLTNIHFLHFFSKYAKEKGYQININEYIGNMNGFVDIFVKVIKSPEETNDFLNSLFYGPDKIMISMKQGKVALLELLQQYKNNQNI